MAAASVAMRSWSMKNSRAAGSRYMNLVVLAARLAVAPATTESRTGE